MESNFQTIVKKNNNEFFGFMNYLTSQEKKLLVLGDLKRFYNSFQEKKEVKNEDLPEVIDMLQEAVVFDHTIYLDVREIIGAPWFYRVNLEEAYVDKISIKEYLVIKEHFIDPNAPNNILTLNFKPFYKSAPSVRDVNSIGKGVEYLNRFLSSQMFNDTEKWRDLLFDFIKVHKYRGEHLILNERLSGPDQLIKAINKAIKKLNRYEEDEVYESFKHDLQDLGFEKGLGRTAGDIVHNLELLDNLMNSPDHLALSEFISSIPMVFNIAVISPHGYFGQEGVLGMPDTGGQVVYILDQVKALEKQLIESLKRSGLDVLPKIVILTRLIPNAGNTKSNKRLEKVNGTKNTWILRIPFRKHNQTVTDNWISRFEIYPYLEEFAEDSYIALKAEFNGRPDLIIGNYSDGNLVSYLLSKQFGVTQCCIAHALEKSKYLYSDLYWNQLEDQYNFSLQFTADLIAMNSSDFQITSTFQEIAGTDNSVGQYETHKHFTLPGLYRVENGVNLYHPKFNILSPGVNERIYFPHTKEEKRIQDVRNYLEKLIFSDMEDEDTVGRLSNPKLTPIFSMARLDSNKNLTSLVKWFGESEELQSKANLVIVAGQVDASRSSDHEEIEQIHLMHKYINDYNLHDKIRWIGKLFRKDEAGEVYRIIADHGGMFVQPGLFEGFGLTVLEAMISGLPVIATQYGGPLEIIQDGKNGFHLDPIDQKSSTEVILNFVHKSNEDEKYWKKISENGIKRVNEAYNWKLYSSRLLSLAKLYGFWKFSTDLETEAMDAYLDTIYHLLYKPRADKLLEKHDQR